MRIYFSCSRAYSVALLVFLFITFFFMAVTSNNKTYILLENEAQRESYIESYGFMVDTPVSTKEITDFENYPQISDFKGKTITEYTYVCNDRYVIRLLMYNNILAGTDYCDLNSGIRGVLDGEF